MKDKYKIYNQSGKLIAIDTMEAPQIYEYILAGCSVERVIEQ